jgi:glucosamine--fructose-6-phosphate aminotransferase (isomerizing)
VLDGSRLQLVRAVGKLRELESALAKSPVAGSIGIGHTRWATHGKPSEQNAHPHVAGKVALIHNGIIENHTSLRARLVKAGSKIASDTDTEIIAHLVDEEARAGHPLETAVRRALAQVEGAYAIAVISESEPDKIIVAKNASPLVIGLGDAGTHCGSDIPAILPYTRRVIILEDGQIAVLSKEGARVSTLDGQQVSPEVRTIDWSPTMAEKAGYKHFMLKEIFEQPRAIEDTLRGRLDREHGEIDPVEIGLSAEQARETRRVYLLACGTSHHAALAGRYFFERLARVETSVELASELRGRDPVIGQGDLVIALSQSGETLDTLQAAKLAKQRGARVLAITNVMGSAIPRLADAELYTRAGPEIGVASTKCFTTQLAALLMLAIHLGRVRGALSKERARDLVEELARLPHAMRDTLQGTRQLIYSLARRNLDARDVLYLGRGLSFPIALEGALKLKEISYVHAEGYAAGEMKHGPIALIDNTVPVVVLLPRDEHRDKTLANLQEAKARGARILSVCTEGDEEVANLSDDVIEVPPCSSELTPFLTVLPLQLYAYYVADLKGTDVDQPRNLAKTVTVE